MGIQISPQVEKYVKEKTSVMTIKLETRGS